MSATSAPRSILFVTGNANKLREVRAILLSSASSDSSSPSFEVESRDLDLPEIQGTTQEVAIAKVKAAAEVVKGPCITEVRNDLQLYSGRTLILIRRDCSHAQDTALGFEALGGLPGPFIKYFMKSVGHEGTSSSHV
jgi:inosine triphosphate pyrophosphatase